LETTGEDPLSHDIKIISISLPNSVCIAETPVLGKKIICDLAGLLEQKEIKKVIYDAKVRESRKDLAGCRSARESPPDGQFGSANSHPDQQIPQGLPQVISRRDGCRTQDR